jgi:hypothetical protein
MMMFIKKFTYFFVIVLISIVLLRSVLITNAYFQTGHFERIVRWDAYPVNISSINFVSEQNLAVALSEINDAFGKEVLRINSPAESDIKIYIEGGPEDISFGLAAAPIIRNLFGDDHYHRALEDGIESIVATAENPCVTSYIFDPDTVDLATAKLLQRPEALIIFISKYAYPELLQACLVEELSHALSFLPDRRVLFGESIFNNNSDAAHREKLTYLDIVTIRTLLSNCVTEGDGYWKLFYCSLRTAW